jgi:hypothetical protein
LTDCHPDAEESVWAGYLHTGRHVPQLIQNCLIGDASPSGYAAIAHSIVRTHLWVVFEKQSNTSDRTPAKTTASSKVDSQTLERFIALNLFGVEPKLRLGLQGNRRRDGTGGDRLPFAVAGSVSRAQRNLFGDVAYARICVSRGKSFKMSAHKEAEARRNGDPGARLLPIPNDGCEFTATAWARAGWRQLQNHSTPHCGDREG